MYYREKPFLSKEMDINALKGLAAGILTLGAGCTVSTRRSKGSKGGRKVVVDTVSPGVDQLVFIPEGVVSGEGGETTATTTTTTTTTPTPTPTTTDVWLSKLDRVCYLSNLLEGQS